MTGLPDENALTPAPSPGTVRSMVSGPAEELTIGQCATLACLLEVAAPKPGNVHRGADFEGLRLGDFLASAVAIGPAMEAASETGVGQTALAAVEATRRVVATNTNLGTVLLLAPLAAVPRDRSLSDGVADVLAAMNADDARCVYEAIRRAEPGGMGRVDEADLSGPPPEDLLAAMRSAAERDLVARQYADGFAEVLTLVAPWLREGLAARWPIDRTVVHVQMRLLAHFPDSLIRRKCGEATARQAADLAEKVLQMASADQASYDAALADFDFWLRSDGHRRNPGTTADLIAAGLFVGLREGWIRGGW